MPHQPGAVRDAIVGYLQTVGREASTSQIVAAVSRRLGGVPASSVRSYLRLNVGSTFERTGRGQYRLRGMASVQAPRALLGPTSTHGLATLVRGDCFDWLRSRDANSVHAVVTDPPYGLDEYTDAELRKLRDGNKGGVWRIPPSFDGHVRSPLPRFTILSREDHQELHAFFKRLAEELQRVLVPGANVVVASNPLLAHIVATGMSEGGLEVRGTIVRLVMTMRGGDRPKNAHLEFADVSVLPRSMFEPWVVLRKPLEGRVQDNLRTWGTGGFRRLSRDKPFGDVIRSSPTPQREKAIAPHPSLKPQAFLRQLVRAVLPLGRGVIYDPFAGSGSTLAAANAVGYASCGTERDEHYFTLATSAIDRLASLDVLVEPTQAQLFDAVAV